MYLSLVSSKKTPQLKLFEYFILSTSQPCIPSCSPSSPSSLSLLPSRPYYPGDNAALGLFSAVTKPKKPLLYSLGLRVYSDPPLQSSMDCSVSSAALSRYRAPVASAGQLFI